MRRGPQPQWAEQEAEIVVAYIAGTPVREITDKFDIKRGSLYPLLKRYGVKVRQQARVLPEAEAERLYVAERWSVKRIGLRYGVSPGRVARVLRARGIDVRKRGSVTASMLAEYPQLRARGMRHKDIAATFGVTGNALRGAVLRHGVVPKRRSVAGPWKGHEQEILAAYRDEGASVREIHRRFQISPRSLYRLLRREGVALRRSATRNRRTRPVAALQRPGRGCRVGTSGGS